MRPIQLVVLLLISVTFQSCVNKEKETVDYTQWSEYLGGPERSHYSSLGQINSSNVHTLQKVWEYKSGDSGQVQCNPIIVDGVLYGVTASNHVFALNAETGKEKWRYVQPGEGTSNANRGVTYWEGSGQKRILYAYGSFLCALDAETGKPITAFGKDGKVSLKAGLEENAKDRFVGSTTPGTLFEDLIVMPTRVGEEPGAAIGYIQAFNVKTGKLEWVFETLPDYKDPGGNSWQPDTKLKSQVGGVNSWAGMAIDRTREIIYIPTGSPAFDFYGGNRVGDNLYANCLLALNVRTGKYLWHYQMVHHDIWDRDLPAPPNLLTVTHEGKKIDAVAQVTKNGYVFVFDRVNGKSLFEINEVQFLKSKLPGEVTSATQPVPSMPAPFARQVLSENDISSFAANKQELLAIFQNAQHGTYQPLGLTPTVLLPGADGGAEWGGAAVDPDGIMYVNANEMPWLFSLSKNSGDTKQPNLSQGNLLYNASCMSCHGPELKGNPASGFPSLINVRDRLQRKNVDRIITSGKGMMPGFAHFTSAQKQSIINFLYQDEKKEAPSATTTQSPEKVPSPYKFDGYNKFLDSDGYPAITPPWGTLTAIDLNTGKHLWRITLGEFKELTAKGIPPTGTENYGGPVVTAGGILFIAATKDGKFRAFDKRTGSLLWETDLPAAGFATPSTYQVNGKQFIVIACGGTKLGTKKGDSYVAFALNE